MCYSSQVNQTSSGVTIVKVGGLMNNNNNSINNNNVLLNEGTGTSAKQNLGPANLHQLNVSR